MPAYIFYDPKSGEITSEGAGDPSLAIGPVGSVLLEAQGAWEENYVDVTVTPPVLRAYTTEQVAEKLQSQEHACVWSNKTFSWEDTRSLNDAQDAQWEQIRAECERINEGPGATFDYGGHTFQSDAKSQRRILANAMHALIDKSFTIWWVLADNQIAQLDANAMLAVTRAMQKNAVALFAQGQKLRAQIYAATDVPSVQAIRWTLPT